MGKRKFVYIGFFFALFFLAAPKAFSIINTFDATTGGAVSFTGNDTKFLKTGNSSGLNMGDNNFTISWWQRTTSLQYRFPRILQFGHGENYSDKFAISEERDGNIYLWINGINITNMAIPGQNAWNHITIERNGYDYSWFVNGNFLSTTHFEYIIPDGGLTKYANFNTTGLDLLIGAGDDPTRSHPTEKNEDGTPKTVGTGSFNGQIAGMQISQSAKWDTNTVFAPATNFLNPGTGFAFSMYVNETDVLDKSGNNLTVVPIVITAGEFSDFNPPVASTPSPSASPSGSPSASPSPSPSDSPSPSPAPSDSASPTPSPSPSGSASPSASPSPSPSDSASPSPSPSVVLTSEIDWDYKRWNSDIWIDKGPESAPFDYRTIKTLAIGIPLAYRDADNNLQKTKCYINLEGQWSANSDNGGDIMLNLGPFEPFSRFVFPGDCQTASGPGHPNGYLDIPKYSQGLFGESQVRVDFVLWTAEVTDVSDVSGAYESLQFDLDIPPEVTSRSIIRGANSETDTSRISFGDTITVTVANETATSHVVMVFGFPEGFQTGRVSAGSNQKCFYYFDPDSNGDFGTTFALPTVQELIDRCRMQFSGAWLFDDSADRSFNLWIVDDAENFSNIGVSNFGVLTLNAVPPIDWSLFPTEVGIDWPLWDTTYQLFKAQNAPEFDYHRVKHVSLGVPVTYTDSSSAVVNTFCYILLPSNLVDVNYYGELEVDVPGFDVMIQMLNSGCSTPHGLAHPSGYEIPDYQYGMLGETQTALNFYLWLEDAEPDFAHPENAFEAVTQNIFLPPEVLSYTITRGSYTETDPEKIYVGDTLNMNIFRGEALYGLGIRIYIHEAFYAGFAPSDSDFCWLVIPQDVNGNFPDTYTIPSKSELSRICHLQLNGDWTYDETASRYLTFDSVDSEGNGLTKVGPLLMASVPTPPAPTPPAPTPPAPTPPAPTPPAPTPPAPELVAPLVEVVKEVVVEPEVIAVPTVEASVPLIEQNVSIKSDVETVSKPIRSEVKAKECESKGVWIFTKSGLLQLCDSKLKVVLAVKACAGKSSTPTFPWVFKAQRFKPGYTYTKSGLNLYYSVFFFKGLAIAGVDKVANAPCSNGSVFIEKKYAKQVYDFIKTNRSYIWVKDR